MRCQRRLRHSSDIPGVTTDEIEAHPEPFLTAERILALRSHKVARLRIEEVPRHLQTLVLRRMAAFGQTDALIAAWEAIGWRDDLHDAWEGSIFDLVPEGRRDAVARLVATRGVEPDDEVVPLEARLLLLEAQPAEYLRLAEEAALTGLMDAGAAKYVELAYALLVRDRFNLPPEDPATEVLEGVLALPDAVSEGEREQLEATRRNMELSAAEASRLDAANERDAAAEEAALMQEETATAQPPRLPVFPARFRDTLESFPESLQRTALRLIGRLAAGEAGAFAGVRRLRANRDICRARVGSDHRLFFRLEPGRMEILDLINRGDFERWLKSRA